MIQSDNQNQYTADIIKELVSVCKFFVFIGGGM